MATIKTIVQILDTEGIKPGSPGYFKELRRATLEYYHMSDALLSDWSKVENFFKKMAFKLKNLYQKSSRSCANMFSLEVDKVRQIIISFMVMPRETRSVACNAGFTGLVLQYCKDQLLYECMYSYRNTSIQ